MEDYLEYICKLIDTKGYARVSDIAAVLNVHPSSVTKMVQKLAQNQYLVYERYRGLILTPQGEKIAKHLVWRHALLERFLLQIGVPKAIVHREVEGVEHHLSCETLQRIEVLMGYLAGKEDWLLLCNEKGDGSKFRSDE
ncbi:transcriptional regulator MntR [Pasteuria penetrans]|uniref:transcriptional regulator MntR n=1 Tax=Pasteuria penetrans TaxID=86005 RepID=UPI0011EE6D5D|nr:transcriptional regulator MntR [Pasteuria penetrans]